MCWWFCMGCRWGCGCMLFLCGRRYIWSADARYSLLTQWPVRLLSAGYLLGRSQDRVHGIAFHPRAEFHDSFFANLADQPVEHIATQVLVGHLASAEAQAGLDLVPFAEEAPHMVALGHVIVLVHVDAELYFFQHDLFLVFLGRAFFLFLLVQVFAVIHDAANRGHGVGRDLYQIELLLSRSFDGIERGHNAQLITVRIDHAGLARADAFVHANKTFVDSILPKFPGHRIFCGIARPLTRGNDLKIIACEVWPRAGA